MESLALGDDEVESTVETIVGVCSTDYKPCIGRIGDCPHERGEKGQRIAAANPSPSLSHKVMEVTSEPIEASGEGGSSGLGVTRIAKTRTRQHTTRDANARVAMPGGSREVRSMRSLLQRKDAGTGGSRGMRSTDGGQHGAVDSDQPGEIVNHRPLSFCV